MKAIALTLVLATLGLAAHAEQPPAGHGGQPPAGHMDVNSARAMMPPPVPPLTNEAKILSVISAPNYTYLEVKLGDKTQWIAAQSVTAAKGDTVLFDNGAVMEDFYSKTLDRTFPSIIFVGNAGVCHNSK